MYGLIQASPMLVCYVSAMSCTVLRISIWKAPTSIRGWFQSSLITALATTGKPPYKTVLTHGFVVDAEGQKMSKSQGNVIAPQAIIKDKGSDILRLWVANTDYTKEMNISPEIIKRTTESYRRIRNTIKFLLSNVNDYDETKEEVKSSDMMLIDKWIIQICLRFTRIN